MATARCVFFSNALGKHTSVNVIFPQPDAQHIGSESEAKSKSGKFKVLYLLHGLSDDESIWSRMTSIERHVQGKNLIVVMPNADRSFYVNMQNGGRYWDYIAEELPVLIKSTFPVSDLREDSFVCGLSMGGYGALKWGLKQPEKFAGACGLSSVADIKDFYKLLPPDFIPEMERIFGPIDKLRESKEDLFYLAEEYAKMENPKTRFLQVCGTEDFLYGENIRFKEHCQKLGLDFEYVEDAGAHTWAFWDKHIQTALKFFGL